jgi:hypothetical protein
MAFTSCESNHLLKKVKKLDYPSASALEYFNGRLYVMGDDANWMLVLDSSLNVLDSIRLFNYPGKRIPKNIKPDVEGMTLVWQPGNTRLLLAGSGSLAPYRYKSFLVDPIQKTVDSLGLDSFYRELSDMGLKEVNIEGIANLPQTAVLVNRGNLGNPANHLVFISQTLFTRGQPSRISLVRMGGNSDTSEFRGISGLCYSRRSDKLIMTVSTEFTANAIDDGAIGKSYLWIVNNINSKRNWKGINPDKIIDLEKVDHRFKGQKIESVCITSETRDFLHLVLAADNDDGSSTLFTMVVEK